MNNPDMMNGLMNNPALMNLANGVMSGEMDVEGLMKDPAKAMDSPAMKDLMKSFGAGDMAGGMDAAGSDCAGDACERNDSARFTSLDDQNDAEGETMAPSVETDKTSSNTRDDP